MEGVHGTCQIENKGVICVAENGAAGHQINKKYNNV